MRIIRHYLIIDMIGWFSFGTALRMITGIYQLSNGRLIFGGQDLTAPKIRKLANRWQRISIQAQILNLLKDLQEQLGLTMLFISHDLPVIRQMCDRVGVMRGGKLCEIAETEQLFNTPAHEYSKHLLGLMPKLDMLPDQN